MTNLKSTIKIALKFFFRRLLQSFQLNKFTNDELVGSLCRYTRIKLLPHTHIHLPFSIGRTIRGVGFSASVSKDPFANFCGRCVSHDSDDSLVEHLYSLYKSELQQSAAEAVGFPGSTTLSKYPAWALVLPWEATTLEEKYAIYPDAFARDRARHGAKFKSADSSNPCHMFYSKENAHSQARQTKSLMKSISTVGLLPLEPLPGICVLVSNDQWRWMMSGDGNHRAYIAYLYGYEHLFAEVNRVIDRQKVASWVNVKNGTYSEEQALQLFDCFFNGNKVRRGLV